MCHCIFTPLSIALFLLSPSSLCYRLDDFYFQNMNIIGKHLANRRLRKFETALQKHLSGPEGQFLSDKNSYEVAMQEVLMSLDLSFVIVESVLADHVLIPQCRSRQPRAFLLEYRVVRRRRRWMTLEEHLREEAQFALEKIKEQNYGAFAAKFHHVKEIVKIGIAFYKKNRTAIAYEVERVNCLEDSRSTRFYDEYSY